MNQVCRIVAAAAALLTSAVAAAQFDPNPVLYDLPDNTALDLGEYTCVGPKGESNFYCPGITDYSGFVYDRHRHQMLMFGGGHSTTMRDDVDVFNFGTLTWGSAYVSTPCDDMIPENFDPQRARWTTTGHPTSRHTYDLMVVTERSREFLLMRGGGNAGARCGRFDTLGGEVAHYDVDARQWSFSGQPFIWNRFASAELDPVSDMVLIRHSDGLYLYDPQAKAAREIDPANRSMGYADNMIYFPPTDRMLYIQRGSPTQVWEVTLDRQVWENSGTALVTGVSGEIPDSLESGWAYDSANRVIGGGIRDGVFYAYDPLTKKWSSSVMNAQSPSGAPIGTIAFHALDYDPVNNVYLFIANGAAGKRTWAYRYAGGPPLRRGDVNCDGVMDAFDIEPFTAALLDPPGYSARWPDCDIRSADVDGDGAINAFDIEPFVQMLAP